MRRRNEGGRCADKIGTHAARIAIADLDRVGRVLLHQPAEQRLRACLRTAPGRRMSDSVVVVEVEALEGGPAECTRPLDALLEGGDHGSGHRDERRGSRANHIIWPGNYSGPHLTPRSDSRERDSPPDSDDCTRSAALTAALCMR